MNVLVVNCGSSSLKFRVLTTEGSSVRPPTARGVVERIGDRPALRFSAGDNESVDDRPEIGDHADAARRALAWLREIGLLQALDAVGHRVVHGGARFTKPALVDDDVLAGIQSAAKLAPLHNRPSLQAIDAVRQSLSGVPNVAVFDTAFFAALPEAASRYPIPLDVAERHGIRRFGFHGIAHRYMAERYAEIAGRPPADLRLITLQLGNGCSAAAIRAGQPVDTSMGLTPLEGLMMGTRSGDVDPSLAAALEGLEGLPPGGGVAFLNERSGLLGVSGLSEDMRRLVAAEATGDTRAALAIDMFCHRVRKYVGAYLAVLGGADALVFGGGIGENMPSIRTRVSYGLEWTGLVLDASRNEGAVGRDERISADGSPVAVQVIAVDEESVIARDTAALLGDRSA